MATDEKKNRPKPYEGFSSPRYTQVPDDFFDTLMPDLTLGETRVLLYIVRRTFGFGKNADNISLRQLSTGIVTADGRQLDRGTGLSKTAVTNALLSLRQKGILIRTLNANDERGNLPTTYRLRMKGEALDDGNEPPDLENAPSDAEHSPLSTVRDKGVHQDGQGVSTSRDKGVTQGGQGVSTGADKGRVHRNGQGLSRQVDTQETVEQERDEQETDRNLEISTGLSVDFDLERTRAAILPTIEVAAREFRDEANLRSSVTRAVNLYARSGVDVDTFLDTVDVARSRTKEALASVEKKSSSGRLGAKNSMPYFFQILTNLLGLEERRRG